MKKEILDWMSKYKMFKRNLAPWIALLKRELLMYCSMKTGAFLGSRHAPDKERLWGSADLWGQREQ
jgi:hypothetical protein